MRHGFVPGTSIGDFCFLMVIEWRLESSGCYLQSGNLPFFPGINPGIPKKWRMGLFGIKNCVNGDLQAFQGVEFEIFTCQNS